MRRRLGAARKTEPPPRVPGYPQRQGVSRRAREPCRTSLAPRRAVHDGETHVIWDPAAPRRRRVSQWQALADRFKAACDESSDDGGGGDSDGGDAATEGGGPAVGGGGEEEGSGGEEEQGIVGGEAEGSDGSRGQSSSDSSSTSSSSSSEGADADEAPDLVVDHPPHLRDQAVCSFRLPGHLGGGSIVAYKNNEIYAYCGECIKHGKRCRVSRRGKGATRRAQGGGRPLGYLMAWLLSADECSEAWDHKTFYKKIDRDTRKHGRDLLRGLAGSEDIFAQERDQADDEESEPER